MADEGYDYVFVRVRIAAAYQAASALGRQHGMDSTALRQLFEMELAVVDSLEESILNERGPKEAAADARRKMKTAAGLDLKSVPMNDKPQGEPK